MSQWIRKLICTVGGVVVEDLRIEFDCHKTKDSNPNEAKIRIFNLKEEHRRQIKDELKTVVLEAGYRDGVIGLIHTGEIRNVINKREGDNDIVTEISSGDADLNHRFARVNKTYPKENTRPKDLILDLYSKMIGVKLGEIKDVDEFPPLDRPYIMSSSVVNEMNTIARKYDLYWSIQNGYLEVISKKRYLNTVTVISKETGMVGTPEPTELGVHVACLMNHNIRPNRLIKVVADSTDASGEFRVNEVSYRGCNHDGDFFCDIQGARLSSAGVQHEKYKKDI